MNEGSGTLGRYLIVLGLVIIVIGVGLVLAGKFPALRIGRLPGDFYVARGNWKFYFPLATSILLSLILSLVLWFFNRKS
jgi:hypothetical protein